MSYRDFVDKAKRYAKFSKSEYRDFWIVAFILAVVFSWSKWGKIDFDLFVGLGNLIIAFIISLIILFVHHMAQRLYALKYGLQVKHKVWWPGIALAFLVAIFSNGTFLILAVSGTYVSVLTIHRLGRYHYGPSLKHYAMIALAGPAANLILAGLVKFIQLQLLPLPAALVDQFFIFSIAFAAWNLLPIPPLDGSRIVFSSRLLYALVIGSVIGYIFLFQTYGIFSWLWAILIGIATWLAFYVILEHSWRAG